MVTTQMVSESATATFDKLELDCGVTLAPVEVAYETYGTLSPARNNAILVLHAFSGDAHAAGDGGWWTNMIGPGKAFDTNRYFVICSNVLGGCRGTTGPGSINPETGNPWAMTFPAITVSDMVRLQKLLIDHLGIPRLLSVSANPGLSSRNSSMRLSTSISMATRPSRRSTPMLPPRSAAALSACW